MAKKYLDDNGLLYFWSKIKTYVTNAISGKADKTQAVSNITRSGTTFTATKADGTTFTFTQQDNTVAKTTTTPKMNGTAAVGSETKYAAGDHVHPTDTSRVPITRKINGKDLSADITLSADDVNAIPQNTFLQGLKLDNATNSTNTFDYFTIVSQSVVDGSSTLNATFLNRGVDFYLKDGARIIVQFTNGALLGTTSIDNLTYLKIDKDSSGNRVPLYYRERPLQQGDLRNKGIYQLIFGPIDPSGDLTSTSNWAWHILEVTKSKDSFYYISAGGKNLTPDQENAFLNISAGSNVTITSDQTTNTISIAATDTKYTAASAAPKMDGTAAVGTSAKYAREDHVHPTDTSRVPTTRKINGKALSSDIQINADDINAMPDTVVIEGIKYATDKSPTAINHICRQTTYGSGSTIQVSLVDNSSGGITFEQRTGSRIICIFLEGESILTSTENIMLQVQGKTAAPIYINGSANIRGILRTATWYELVFGPRISNTTTDYGWNVVSAAGTEQNVFDNFTVGSSVFLADSPQDGLQFVAGSNVTLTPDTTAKTITIAATDTKYSSMTQTDADAGTATTGRLITAKVLDTKIDNVINAAKGANNGLAPLNSTGTIDSEYLPSFVDDVVEAYPRSGQTALSKNWLATGSASGAIIQPQAGVIYILMADSGDYVANTQFRWSGSTYVEMAGSGTSAITNGEIDTITAT